MAYHLYVNNMEEIKTKTPSKESRPLYFNLDGKRKNSFKITEIDSLLCQYKSSENLVKALKKFGYIKKNETDVKLILGLNSNNTQTEIPIFYNNNFLAQLAISFRNLNSNQLIEKTEEISNFIKYIKSLVLNKTTRNYIINPARISILSNEEQYKLKKYFPENIKIDNGNREIKMIGGILQSYVHNIETLEKLRKDNQSTAEVDKDLREISKEIDEYFRSDYQHIRKVIEWEDLYKNILNKHIRNEKEDKSNVEILLLQVEKIDIARDNRQNPLIYNEIIYEDEEDLYETLLKDENIITDNEILDYLYKTGGSEEVFKYMDIDELYSDANIENSKKIGIITHNK